MYYGKRTKRIISVMICFAVFFSFVFSNMNDFSFAKKVSADNLPIKTIGSGSIGIGSNETEASKLPRISTQGTYRFTTDNYNKNHQALDTNDWASNWLWDLEGDRDTDETNALSGTSYAFPMCYLMKKDGLRVNKPSMTSNATNVSAYNIKDNDTLGEFKISPEWTCTNNNIDQITDWSYEALTTSGSKSMRTIMTQGSPFTFLELTNSNVLYLEKLRVTFPSKTIYEDIYNGSKILVFRTNDITSSVNGYPGLTYQYYAIYLPEEANVEHTGTTDNTGNDGIGKLKITLPSNKSYMTLAWLCEGQNYKDDTAINYAKEYRPYAFNFITNTQADYQYNESNSTIDTTYQYTVSKKDESTADGTIMGILPHQYKYMSGYSYMEQQAVTLRGMMKFLKGSSYKTSMTYKGILPYMPSLSDDDTEGREQLKKYVKAAANESLFVNESGQETYYHGKKLNRAVQLVAAAKSVGDDESADKVLNKLEANLTEWFTYSGEKDKNYFTYLGEGVGVLLGYPTSFNAVDQFNDHHFHYGYFIEAAASVGLYDKEWLDKYKDVVKQLVYDIASPYRNQADCVTDCGNAYPYLRSFSPYEGHSWASGYEDERTGNNQESTSEAINAWAGIILFGELTGDTKIRDLGIYLYTTEVAAADNYWFDIDKDIYHIENSKYEPPMASMVWGGKADYATWFGQKYTQGIQICPMQSWSFYLLNGGKDYIKEFYNYDKNSEFAKGGSVGEWNDMWAAYYALADPEYAMNTVWTKQAVNDGETQAHTYHYIKSLMEYGTPDLSFKSTSAMGSVFNKNGKYTFAVYNPTSSMQSVKFTNDSGYTATVKASPNAMTLVNSDDVGKATYTVEYYGKDLNSSNYSLVDTTVKYANAGERVTVSAKNLTGYTYDSSNSNNILTGIVTNDGSLVLKVYYNRANYSVSYNMNSGNKVNTSLYPESYTYGQTYSLDKPVRDGYDFYGWYGDASFEKRIESITANTNGNLTLHAKWVPAGTILLNDDIYLSFDSEAKGIFTINGSTGYKAINVLYRIVNTESEAAQLASERSELGFVSWGMERTGNGWTRNDNFSGSKGQYIVYYFIRYDDNGGYKTDYAYGKIVAGGITSEVPSTKEPITTEAGSTKPKAPFGLVYAGNDALPYYFAWAGMEDVTYNFYVNGKCVATGITGSAYSVSSEFFQTSGEYTIGITAVKDGVESDMCSMKHTFEGETPTTEVPTTTEAPTTTEIPTTEETTTEEPTTPEETTPAKPEIVVNDNVQIEGYQISTISEGSRVIGSVEPVIEGKKVSKWGFVYAIIENGDQTYTVDDSDMYVGATSPYVAFMESTNIGTIPVNMGTSTTATYFARTTLFSAKNAREFNAKYKVRAYALMEDGSYYYSTISSYRVFNIAKTLYNKGLMNNFSGHEYLYNNILKVVDADYKEVDYNWQSTIVKGDSIYY